MNIRKNIVICVHTIAVILAVNSYIVLHYNEYQNKNTNNSRLVYEDTEAFEEHFYTTTNLLMQNLANKIIFETDGKLDMNKELFRLYYPETKRHKSYTLENLIRYGKQTGIYIDNFNELQVDESLYYREDENIVLEWCVPEILLGTYVEDYKYNDYEYGKPYISFYDMVIELMREFSEYNKTNAIIGNESNYKYYVSYSGGVKKEIVYTNFSDSVVNTIDSLKDMNNIEDIRHLKDIGEVYIYDSSRSAKPIIEFEIIDSIQLSNWIVINNLYNNIDYDIIISVDQRYLVEDEWSIERNRYEALKHEYIMGNVIFAVSFITSVISLFLIIAINIGIFKKSKLSLKRIDSPPIEMLIVAMLVIAIVGYFSIGVFWQHMYAYIKDKPLISNAVQYMYLYVILIILFCSILRQLRLKAIGRKSYTIKFIKKTNEYLKYKKVLQRVTILFLIYILINTALVIVGFKDKFLALFIAIVWNCIVLFWIIKWSRDIDIIKNKIHNMSTDLCDLEEFQMEEKLHGDAIEVSKDLKQIAEKNRLSVEEQMKSEKMKTSLITNVSHDLKTPLTSIINYIDLLKRENIENDKVKGYIEILAQKAERLKVLTEDLVEASKASSGNIKLELAKIDIVELLNQTAGEFDEKLTSIKLEQIINLPKSPVIVMADGARLWRVFENLYSNITKYTLSGTRVYIDMEVSSNEIIISMKNVSKYPLNMDPIELTERFIRGDVSRSTEGSGLGLAIAKSFMELHGGKLDIKIDGDLYKAILTIPIEKQL